jgi:glycosyltransferase involved in cell wall biosynthesis
VRSLEVLHVTPYYEEAWGYGGIPRVASAVCQGLVARGHRVSVATTDARDGGARLSGGSRLRGWSASGRGGVEVRVFPNLSNRIAFGRQFFVPLGLSAYLAKSAGLFDLIHIHGHHHLPSVLAARAATRAGVPYLITPNGLVPRDEGQRAAKWIFDTTLGRHVLRDAARITATTEAERSDLLACGLEPERLRLLPNPLELEAFEAPGPPGALRQQLRARGARAQGPVVLYLGTLIPQKGVDVLVRALVDLAPEVTLAVAGPDLGGGARARRAVKELGLEERVLFLGRVEGQARAGLLADADLVAYPGRAESFGLVPLEALVCGSPVVVGDDSGSGELIASVGGGLLVPPGDAPALARALGQILEDPERWGALARAGGEEVRRRFGPAAVAARAEEIYTELVS